MSSDVTVIIVARNTEATIERAIRSALAQGGGPVVLVDDHSSDETAARARRVAGSRLTVVSPGRHDTIGRARRTGIEAVTTRFAMWVDADDEAMPGRAVRLLSHVERRGVDIVYDAAELYNGVTGAFIRHMPIPAYLQLDPMGVRQFERNVIPSLGWPLVRVSWAQQIGYDVACHGVEDYDFMLRSVMAGACIGYESTAGYRQFAYHTSVSRQLPDRRAGVRALLQKHRYPLVRARFGAAGHADAITAWALVALAFYREDWDLAATFIAEAGATIVDPERVLEPDGPCPYPEGWRHAFYLGTLALLTGQVELARRQLEIAQRFARTPESSNNLGVALARLGVRAEAHELFREALRALPSYLDAAGNLAASRPSCITSHPLRQTPSRSEYQGPGLGLRANKEARAATAS